MSGLISDILRNAQSLNLHGRAVETAGHNLANQNDPAFARQRLAPKEASTIYTTFGLQPGGVNSWGREHARSYILDKQIVKGQSDVAYAEAQRDIRENLQIALGEEIDRQSSTASLDTIPDSDTVEGSLSRAIDEFFNAFQELSASPDDSAAKEVLFQKAEILTTRFNLVDERVEQVRGNLQEKVTDDISKVENLLDKITEFNSEIFKLEYKKKGLAVELRDERQKAIEELAELISIEMVQLNDSLMGVSAKTDAGDNVVLIDASGKVGSLINEDGQLAFDPSRGSIAGLLDSETAIDKLKNDNIDLLAAQLVKSVNEVYNDGTVGDFFDATTNTAGGLKLDTALTAETIRSTHTTFSGANDVALNISELADKPFSKTNEDLIEGTFGEFIASTAARVGQDLRTADADFDLHQLTENRIIQDRQELGSVNVDEEVTDLMRYQRSFQATSKVIGVLDQLLETVVTSLVR
ncbi:MAG: flagellar hook-associated protein FlgK [Opitutae bacterium]|jgi:flagellar hook-associated protein 1 FlgK|nr:flagellar hook-associated protein FlgK [Opitutae bacterium]MBT7851734.1 flagellar hook-associated protein FlgK [Opitutae bacterium]